MGDGEKISEEMPQHSIPSESNTLTFLKLPFSTMETCFKVNKKSSLTFSHCSIWQAVSLNCSHVFCKLCINRWMKVKKECPNCRTAVKTQLQAIALDSYIERMVERFSDDLKARRKSVVELRKGGLILATSRKSFVD